MRVLFVILQLDSNHSNQALKNPIKRLLFHITDFVIDIVIF